MAPLPACPACLPWLPLCPAPVPASGFLGRKHARTHAQKEEEKISSRCCCPLQKRKNPSPPSQPPVGAGEAGGESGRATREGPASLAWVGGFLAFTAHGPEVCSRATIRTQQEEAKDGRSRKNRAHFLPPSGLDKPSMAED
ncbi:hypothetical protein BCV69DRAFT_37694 [Microstroma glucosiphilum]|uniref:Uncharacterized protein n=1 Tax=Pseudomicrostroma glucosiphilum TaxID=1684307 RepID=A0A316U8S6_9BASI|nr:hypothetical protein BCV69DRAFT_37694 [Pseudomicrostroma glucosiphilum]PWN19385.1 hypothetical protein BCV69DRAFT_37694 [Pseudomicrostroma glucosiphilum]